MAWLALMARQFYSATDQRAFDNNLQAVGDSLLASIDGIGNAGEARAMVAATSTLINDNYRKNNVEGAVLMELRDGQGQLLYRSPEGSQARLHGAAGTISAGTANGRRFRIYAAQVKHWSLMVAAPQQGLWWILKKMSGELTLDMLIAFPFVLLPVWLAVRRGLHPLRNLSELIASRGAENLSALNYESRYAELQPLVSALDSLISRLRHQLKREQGFVQDAAHELRTPMAVISAQAHVLAMTGDPEQRAQAEQRMNHAIARASHLVGQLLDLAQIDHHQIDTNVGIDAAQLLRQELAALVPAATARNIDLSLESPDALHAELETHAFQSIVHNLVTNALAYVQENGQVRVELAARHGEISLSVADDGPGIAPELRELVFERFYRGKAHDTPGSGLGLAIVREATARLRGTVGLRDGIGGKGCLFVVTLPGSSQPCQ